MSASRRMAGGLQVAVAAALAAIPARSQLEAPRAEPSIMLVSLLDNGGFDAEPPSVADDAGIFRVPWWITTRGIEQLVDEEGARALLTRGSDLASQPIAAFAPLVAGIVVRGEIRGEGVLALIDGSEAEVALEVSSRGEGFEAFELHGSAFERRLGRPLVPRLVLQLSSEAPAGARWRALEVLVPLPLPGEAELAARIESELDWILATWLERAIDAEGPRPTAFFTHAFDAVTGERASDIPGGFSSLYELFLPALEARERSDWRSAFERYLADLFELALHPATGLPRSWNGSEDVPDEESFVEIAGHMGFLIDLAERGPESFRARARDAAVAMGETVLARGVMPDGAIAARYRSRDGEPNTSVTPVRALNLPAQLTRLGVLADERRFVAAADEALARYEYTHYWPGNWSEIDPGFDDEYGNFGARATEIWRAVPGHPMARRIALGGYEHYAPLWKDALRLGGNVAADQVRCWQVCTDVAELEGFDAPRRADLASLLRAALRSHFKGEQYGNGAWGDVTVHGFDPKDNLQVGDLPGLPQNLLQGIALLYEERSGLRDDETRACFAAVLESSIKAYKRPYGYLATRRELEGRNLPYGSLRLAAGLVEMLRRL